MINHKETGKIRDRLQIPEKKNNNKRLSSR